jgi:vacuolar-type H+-ATPase subunit I/STV1
VEACRESGGNADGHAVAASGWIPRGQEEDLVRKLNDVIGRQ